MKSHRPKIVQEAPYLHMQSKWFNVDGNWGRFSNRLITINNSFMFQLGHVATCPFHIGFFTKKLNGPLFLKL